MVINLFMALIYELIQYSLLLSFFINFFIFLFHFWYRYLVDFLVRDFIQSNICIIFFLYINLLMKRITIILLIGDTCMRIRISNFLLKIRLSRKSSRRYNRVNIVSSQKANVSGLGSHNTNYTWDTSSISYLIGYKKRKRYFHPLLFRSITFYILIGKMYYVSCRWTDFHFFTRPCAFLGIAQNAS